MGTTSQAITHDEAGQRFVLDRDGLVSHLAYRRRGPGTVDFVSTWVHPQLRGSGIGARLVEHGLLWAEAQGLKVIPTCWFVAEYLERNPRFQPLDAGR